MTLPLKKKGGTNEIIFHKQNVSGLAPDNIRPHARHKQDNGTKMKRLKS